MAYQFPRQFYCYPLLFVFLIFLSPGVRAAALPDFSSIVEENLPAVVKITVTQNAETRSGSSPGHPHQLPEEFRRYFGDGFGKGPRGFGGPPSQRNRTGQGSGIIISEDGYILTNNHVVDGADEIRIALSDRRELTASLVGGDALSDLALLKVDAKGLPVAELGDSDDLKVGEWVLAIGTPLGFEHSVTQGIVSAKGRTLDNETYVPFIQTDVAINRGNSGGPLFDLDGKVVGINARIYSGTGGYIGLSFAIPVNDAKLVVEQIKSTGQVERGRLGVAIQDLSVELARAEGLDKPEGAIVVKVMRDSPAEAAGIKVGDVILEFNDKHIIDSSALKYAVGATRAGTEASTRVLRNGKEITIEVTVGSLDVAQTGQSVKPAADVTGPLGLTVGPLPGGKTDQAGVDGGVLVKRVTGESARRAGILPGDIITNVNHTEIHNPEDFNRAASGLTEGKWVPVRVVRNGGATYLAIQAG